MLPNSSTRLLHNTLQYLFKTTRCYCSVTPFPNDPNTRIEERVEKKKRSMIIDKKHISVRGGTGGQGTPSVGGVGGDGGSVFIKCLRGASLAYYAKGNTKFRAQEGKQHRRNRLVTENGNDLFLNVPPGTEIRWGHDNPGMKTNELIHDMDIVGDFYKLAQGGRGGCPANDYNGSKGERKTVYLELKTIADAALTGFPNAGKSTLLRAISRAVPRVGDYPFTTIRPMVGSVMYSDKSQVKVADLPGLIEGAHQNKGMGHKFLRHIERTKVVILVVDINGFQLKLDSPHRSPFEMIVHLLKELALYQEVILNRPMLLLFNKMDSPGAERRYGEAMEELHRFDVDHELLQDFQHGELVLDRVKQFRAEQGGNVFKVSAENNTGLNGVKMSLHRLLASPPEIEKE